jgi:hypothetical protein
MGLLGKMIGGAIGAKLLKKLGSAGRAPAGGQYIPANELDTVRTPVVRGTGGMVDRAGRFYKENPKLVHTLGSAALAIALARLAQRRRI